jgi:phosphate transport system substrate-binding protein
MNEKFFKRTAAALMLVTAAVSISFAEGKKVVIKGSTTVLPIALKASEEYRKISDTLISIEGSGSGNGIKALMDGTCDIANSSREMKAEEKEAARGKGMDVKEIAISYDMIIPIVHPSNPARNLTIDQLREIYAGNITNWKEVGGPDMKIVVISRDSSSGTFEYWNEKVMKKGDISRSALLQASNGAVVTAISQNKKAIGYIGYGYLNKNVKAIDVNGVHGTIENGKSGKYPISRKLYMYVNNNKLSKEADGFIKFILGPKGQALVKEQGFIPLR